MTMLMTTAPVADPFAMAAAPRAGFHLLLVDPDRDARAATASFLIEHGFRVSTAGDGGSLWKARVAGDVDLIVLDQKLPGEDGFSLCRRLRETGRTPIVMLGGGQDDTDRIIALELGADDYLNKPCNPRELLARIRAVLRRTRRTEIESVDLRPYQFDGWRLDPARRALHNADGGPVDLSSGGFALLQAFVRRPMQVLSREALFTLANGRVLPCFGRSIDVQVSRLRKRLDDDREHPRLIKTVRFGGYVFTARVERAAA